MKHTIIYVPGIRDDLYKGQSAALRFWRLWGVQGHLHEIPWSGSEPYEIKFERLLATIDKYLAKGRIVSLMGASAGASAVLDAYLARKASINAVVFVCGKLNQPAAVSSYTYGANPAFRTAMAKVAKNVEQLTEADKRKMLSLYSPVDRTVPHKDTIIPGVAEAQLLAISHGKAIIYSLTIGARRVSTFMKQRAKRNPN